MRALLVGLFVFLTVLHADVTGTWSGPLAMKNGEETKDDSAYLVLKQTGGVITGTIGPNVEKRLEITKGTAEGNDIHLEAIVEGENKLVLNLKLEGGKLIGDLKAARLVIEEGATFVGKSEVTPNKVVMKQPEVVREAQKQASGGR